MLNPNDETRKWGEMEHPASQSEVEQAMGWATLVTHRKNTLVHSLSSRIEVFLTSVENALLNINSGNIEVAKEILETAIADYKK